MGQAVFEFEGLRSKRSSMPMLEAMWGSGATIVKTVEASTDGYVAFLLKGEMIPDAEHVWLKFADGSLPYGELFTPENVIFYPN